MSKVLLKTNHGDIILQLDAEKAPVTTANFIRYVKEGFYDGTLFSRVIQGFMIQGGGYEPGMKKKTTHEAIQNEAGSGLKNRKYTIAMARTMEPHSATAEFFINTSDNDFLDHSGKDPQGWGYAVFGQVSGGLAVVDAIEKVATGPVAEFRDVPKQEIIIERAALIE